MPLVPAVLRHVDNVADIQRQPQMWLPVLGAFITLERKRRGQGFQEWREEERHTLTRRLRERGGGLHHRVLCHPAQLWALHEDRGCGCSPQRREAWERVSLGNLPISELPRGSRGHNYLLGRGRF